MESKFKNILLPLILLGNFCFAQESYTIDLEPKNIDSLSNNFYIVKVEDERQRKNKIGAIQIDGKMYAANFPRPFEDYTYATLARMNPYSKKGQPIRVKIHQFLIEEKMGLNKNFSTATVQLEFFSVNSSKSIGIITATAQEEKGTKIIRKHSLSILKALEKCLLQFDSLNTSFYTDSKISLNIPPKAGLYFSFSEVMLGQPTVPKKPVKLEVLFTELERYKLKSKEKKEALKSLYGISDGTNFYLNARLYSKESYFIKAKFVGTYYYFEDIVYNNNARIPLGVVGGIVGGAVGGMVAGAISEKKVGIIIDTTNGVLRILDKLLLEELIKGHHDLQQMYDSTNKKLTARRAIINQLNKKLNEKTSKNK